MTTQHADEPGTVAPPRHAPLLLTLTLGAPAQGLFQGLRERHFPAACNVVPAHVSLFHSLPGRYRQRIVARLRALGEEGLGVRPRIAVAGPYLLGRGLGFRLVSAELQALHGVLARDWGEWLTRQDQQPYRPHMTVQNKVEPEVARALLARLERGFVPFATEGVALRLWRYLDGPWEALETVALEPVVG